MKNPDSLPETGNANDLLIRPAASRKRKSGPPGRPPRAQTAAGVVVKARLTDDEHRLLQAYMSAHGLSVSDTIREALRALCGEPVFPRKDGE